MRKIVCPWHKTELIIGQESLRIKGQQVWLLTGHCTICRVRYIGKQIKIGNKRFVKSFEYDGKTYEYIPQMERIEASMDLKMQKKNKISQKKNFVKRISEVERTNGEIAMVSATVDEEKVILHIIKQKNENTKFSMAKNERCIRSTELLSREILGRIAHRQLEQFSTPKETVKIHSYKIWSEEEYNLYGFKRFSDVDNLQTITIMNQKNLPGESSDFEMVTALVYCAGRELPVYIDVYYSKLSDTYFINSESYEIYSRRYGLPYLKIVPYDSDECFDYDNLRQNSELNLYGYSVSKEAGLTTVNRQRLLQQLLDNHLMTKSQIVNHLEWLLNTHKYRESMRDACECWKEDIMFVNQCQIKNQRMIWGKFKYRGTALK